MWFHVFLSKTNNFDTVISVAEAKYGIIFKTFLFLPLSPIFEKKKNAISQNVHDYSITFLLNFYPNMSKEEKKRQRIYDLLNAEIKTKEIPK